MNGKLKIAPFCYFSLLTVLLRGANSLTKLKAAREKVDINFKFLDVTRKQLQE